MSKFQQWARDNFKPGITSGDEAEMWHPEIQAERKVMIAEAAEAVRAKKEADQQKVKQVVESVADLEEQMKGKIVIFVRFKGSLTKTQKMTTAEVAMLRGDGAVVDAAVARKCGADKPLFGKFEAYEKLERKRNEWKEQLKRFGIPFFGEGMTVLDIRLIPEVESLFDEIDRDLPKLTEEMLAAYPEAIKPEAVDIGPLYNPRDYPAMEELRRRFFCTRKWMSSFDVPEILKEVDQARWEAERKRSAALWAEVRLNGMVLLRKQFAEATERLVEAVQPDEKGGKKRFYATAVTNLTDLFDSLKNRDLAGDTELTQRVEEFKALISNQDIENFKTDESLRKKVATVGAAIVKQAKTLLVDAKSRVISYED